MATLKEVARVTARGRNLPDISGGELKANAWLVHQSALAHAERSHSRRIQEDGAWGYEWYGHLKAILRELWPGIPAGNEIHADATAVRSSEVLYKYLRVSGNVVCLERGLKTPSRWFIREEWNDAEPSRSVRANTAPRTVRVTPHEAGEDREPEPVTSTYKCPYCPAVLSTRVQFSAHIYTYAKHVDLEELVVKGLAELPVPSTPRAVFGYLSEHLSFLGSEGLINNRLRDAARNPRSQIVLARVPGRTSPTYTLRSRLPEMPAHASFGCREPGCGAANFSTAYYRADHENAFHADSPNRAWKCHLGSCKGSFYDASSLGTHLWRVHHLTKSAPETADKYLELMEEAAKSARTYVPKVLVDPWPVPAPSTTPAAAETEETPVAEPPAQSAQPDELDEPEKMHQSITEALERVFEENATLRRENSDLRAQVKSMGKLAKLAKVLETLKDED